MQLLAMSPGIPLHFPAPHPIAVRAREAGCPIVGDIELLYRAEPTARYIGITGTNGKSTTTSLIGHILAEAGMRIAVGGNLGTAVLTFPPLGAGGAYVLEMSSYQLDLLDRLVFDIAAVLLNITPDHLDRHGGMDGYITAKERIFAGQDRRQGAPSSASTATPRAASLNGLRPRAMRGLSLSRSARPRLAAFRSSTAG